MAQQRSRRSLACASLRKRWIATFVAATAGATSAAHVGAAEPTPPAVDAAPAATATGPIVEVTQTTLPNGLTLLLSPDRRLPVVTTELRYLVGSGHERIGRTGFAHLFEHLMFQGSEHHDQEYFQPFERIGGSVNGSTGHDSTNYYERVPSNFLELSLWMESDRMRSLLPVLGQDKLDNQRDVVKNERRQRYEAQPYGMAWWYMGEALFPPGHPYRHSPIGSHEDLSAASLEDVKSFFEQYYVPANAVLAVVGDFEPKATQALVEKYFGDIPGGERAQKPVAEMPELAGITHWVKQDDVELPRVYLAWHTPALYAPGDAELDLWSRVLTGGKTSRLFQPLVYDQKVAKDVAAFQVSQRLSSFYVIQATAAAGVSIEELHAALEKALRDAVAKPPTDEELRRARNDFKKNFYAQIESVTDRASLLTTYYLHTGTADYLSKDLARYVEATPAGVHEAAKKWLDLESHVRLDFVPGDRAAPLEKRTDGKEGEAAAAATTPTAKAAPTAKTASPTTDSKKTGGAK